MKIIRNPLFICHILVVLMLLAVTQTPFPEISGNAQEGEGDNGLPPPEVRIEMDSYEEHADVEPGGDGIVSFSGKCYCTLPPGSNGSTMVGVYLVMDAGGLPISNPPSLVFSQSTTSRSFIFSAQVPLERDHRDDPILKIGLQWRYLPDGWKRSTDSVTECRIIVDQYSKLFIEREIISDRTPVGEWGARSFKVINWGNGDDRAFLEIVSTSKKLDAKLDRDHVDVERDERNEFNVKIRQGSGKPGRYEVRIRAWSDVKGNGNDTYYDIPFLTKTSLRSFTTTPSQYMPVISISLILILVVAWVILRSRLFPDEDEGEDEVEERPRQESGKPPKRFKGQETPTKGLYKSTSNKRS
ncbi:MAG: choice-of-anchor T family protein [Thermoplasmatota archaeon]